VQYACQILIARNLIFDIAHFVMNQVGYNAISADPVLMLRRGDGAWGHIEVQIIEPKFADMGIISIRTIC
jgi:hypothetical protein